MGSDGGKPPPRTLDVRKYAETRAAELHSLHSLISNRLNNDFRSHRNKRRRTTAFETKNRRHRKRLKPSNSGDDENEKEKTQVPRRVRRRLELKKNPESGFSTSGDGTKRLRTHVWHAKRFRMEKLWGFYLPIGLHGRGRGSRALLKWYKQGAVVHDASYYRAVQLEGPKDALVSILSSLLEPSSVDHSEDLSNCILSGDIYGHAMLHYAGQDGSKAICPVTYLWRPVPQQENGVGKKDKETESSSHFRQLWMWMHPSASGEGFNCLKLACQKMMDETGIRVCCVCLDGQLARLEVMGSRAFQLLQKILLPLTLSLQDSLEPRIFSTVGDTDGCEIKHYSILENEEHFSSNAAVSLTVVDPRSLSHSRSVAVPDAHLSRDLCGLAEDKGEENPAGNLHMKEEVLSTLQSKYESDSSLSNCKDLWDASKGVHPPMEEHILCMERRQNSLAYFRLKDTSSAKSESTEGHFSRCCPILMLRNTDEAGLLTGWSIILPISWVKAFWIPLVSCGAHAIGLREKRWISGDVCLPYFPSDFPDCNAYSCIMEREAAAIDETMERRAPSMRPFKVPIQLPWNSSYFAFGKGSEEGNGIDFSSNTKGHGNHLADLNDELTNGLPVNNSGSCEVFVARTSRLLISFLKEISGDHLLLFPKGLGRESFSHLMKNEARISQASNPANAISHERRLCYLRVLLNAFKEGVLDEGAVVCAPFFSDISLWTSRSGNNEGLQVPHAFIGSYFKEVSSGKWEFHLPEDPAAREAYRRPLGFVTTGFVRGSKRPSAVALCEAVLLARLRHEQWSQTPVKKRRKEIFVLVRNLRSTAYRLALATVILEGQEEDAKSL